MYLTNTLMKKERFSPMTGHPKSVVPFQIPKGTQQHLQLMVYTRRGNFDPVFGFSYFTNCLAIWFNCFEIV